MLRQMMLKKRRELDNHFRNLASKSILSEIQKKQHVFKNKVVALYADFKGEIPTSPLFLFLKEVGATVVYPKNYSYTDRTIKFFHVSDLDELKENRFGLKEPFSSKKEVPLEGIDIFFVPGVAFDERGYRVGYGTGCYDRAFASLRAHPHLYGLAYDFQVVGEVSEQEHDIRVEEVITEKRVIYCREQ